MKPKFTLEDYLLAAGVVVIVGCILFFLLSCTASQQSKGAIDYNYTRSCTIKIREMRSQSGDATKTGGDILGANCDFDKGSKAEMYLKEGEKPPPD